MGENIDIVDYISTLLDSGKYKEAISVPNEEKFANSFKDNCWDLISVVIGKIQDDTIVIKPSMYGACEQLLSVIIQKSSPEEALLEFIEQVELAKNDAQFGLVLPPLQDVLKKFSTKRGRSLEWCLNSISTYIENIPISEHHLEGQERLLMDSDSNVRRVTRVYTLLPPFYRYFINELDGSEASVKTKQIITAFLISLLGKPLIYIDLDPEGNEKSEARLSCSEIVQDICVLEKNVFKFLDYIEVCHRASVKNKSLKDSEDENSPYENRDKINITTLSGLFYAIFSGHFQIPQHAVPQVYRLDYVLNTVMLCGVHLLSFAEYSPLAKALSLCEAILSRFPPKMSYDFFSPVHIDMCKGLVNVAIYSSYESLRKRSVGIIGTHVNKFDYKGRCTLIKFLIEISNHSGMIGYAITLYKNSINEAFKDPKVDECFTGAQLSNMIKKICLLPHGAESDLVELADQIISALNFLRYLTIKDADNITGIRDNFSFIENNYLEKLRVGLNMSKAHYEVKLKDIEEGKDLPEENVNVSINVGGNVLDKIPKENKKEIICSALNAFHLIEGLMARLSECININKMQGLKMNCD
ncbi:glomulin-like isoform X1 [Anticarsia gemmatalis]|uniref:glomulin-like isoform X1 n=1 Tax=Anticarsia gemmatalis TaxID=129554 RepID=UPI003F76019A